MSEIFGVTDKKDIKPIASIVDLIGKYPVDNYTFTLTFSEDDNSVLKLNQLYCLNFN